MLAASSSKAVLRKKQLPNRSFRLCAKLLGDPYWNEQGEIELAFKMDDDRAIGTVLSIVLRPNQEKELPSWMLAKTPVVLTIRKAEE